MFAAATIEAITKVCRCQGLRPIAPMRRAVAIATLPLSREAGDQACKRRQDRQSPWPCCLSSPRFCATRRDEVADQGHPETEA